MGLDAVKTYCKEMGAAINIKVGPYQDDKRVPFSFELILPKDLFWLPPQQGDMQLKASA